MKAIIISTNLAWLFILAITMGIYSMDRDYVSIRVIDRSGCTLESYRLVLKDKTIVVSEQQRGEGFLVPSLGDYDTLISFFGYGERNGVIPYTLLAYYSDCEKITSPKRTAKQGQIIYETVSKEGVSYLLRSG